MSILTVRSRRFSPLFAVILGLGLIDSCLADNDSGDMDPLDLVPGGEYIRKGDDLLKKGRALLPGGDTNRSGSNDDNSGSGSNNPGQGYKEQYEDLPEPKYSKEEIRRAEAKYARQRAEEISEHDYQVKREGERLRYSMKSEMENCKFAINNNSMIDASGRPVEAIGLPHSCHSAHNIKANCYKVAKDIDDRRMRLIKKYEMDRPPYPALLSCHDVFAGLPDPLEAANEEKQKAKNKQGAASENNRQGSPTKEQVMDYVQRSAQDCLRRYPGGSPGNLTPEQAACVQEKTKAYQNGAR